MRQKCGKLPRRTRADRDASYMRAHPVRWLLRRITIAATLAITLGALLAGAWVHTARNAGWRYIDVPDLGTLALIIGSLIVGVGASWLTVAAGDLRHRVRMALWRRRYRAYRARQHAEFVAQVRGLIEAGAR